MRGAVSVLLCALLLTGCTAREHMTLTGDEIASGPCSEVMDVAVETLATLSTRECNPLGSTLVFPDGETLEIGDGGGGSSSSRSQISYGYTNVGTLGIVATRYSGACLDQEVWGPPAAVDKVVDTFGDDLGHC